MEHKLRRYAAVLAALVMGLCAGLTINVSQFLRTTEPQSRTEEVDAGVEKYKEIMGLVDEYFIGDDVDITAVNDAMASGNHIRPWGPLELLCICGGLPELSG